MALNPHFFSRPTALALLLGAVAAASGQDAAVTETRTLIQEWVRTSTQISEERSEWQAEQHSLQATRDVLQAELEGLGEALEELRTATTAADEEKAELNAERADLRALQTKLAQRITSMEDRIRDVVGRFPLSLQNTVQPLLQRIPSTPEDAEGMPLGGRLANILGVLQQAERFNSTLTFGIETKEIEGQRLRCKVLYWGLAGAYFVTEDGSTAAGVGSPGADGWSWTVTDLNPENVALLMRIYEGASDPVFVTLPVDVQ